MGHQPPPATAAKIISDHQTSIAPRRTTDGTNDLAVAGIAIRSCDDDHGPRMPGQDAGEPIEDSIALSLRIADGRGVVREEDERVGDLPAQVLRQGRSIRQDRAEQII